MLVSKKLLALVSDNLRTAGAILVSLIKDVHRRQKLMTVFFKFYELTVLVVTISISRKIKYAVPGGHFLRGLITKS